MAIVVDIADRLYDYSDEEKAAEAIADFQSTYGIDDQQVIELWQTSNDPRRAELERLIFDAVDANGTVQRAKSSIPGGLELSIEEETMSAQ